MKSFMLIQEYNSAWTLGFS